MKNTVLIMKFAATLMIVVLLWGCSGEEQESSSKLKTPYDDWKTYSYQNIEIRYPVGHLQEGTFEDISRVYQTMIKRACGLLHINVPGDTLRIIYHTGFGQGRELTGHEYPYATGDTIFFWLPSFYGPTLMQYLIPRWHPEEPRHIFLKHGLIALLDFSGQNYHTSTARHIHTDRFIPLAELAVTINVNSDTERYESAMSASFVDYIIYTYGIKTFDSLYLSQRSFEDEVRNMLDLSLDSLQEQWLEMSGEAAKLDTAGYRRYILEQEG
ncbi:MAG: hypothetical protein KOO62_13420 [candidate division Zixibacteria bacterium]|nr:hypothetical protein [candidate division Zixibacteria bacterium]